MYYYYRRTKEKRSDSLSKGRTVNYKQGYMIVISGKFYEVAEGRKIVYFGKLKHKPTVQEIWNKTVRLEQEEQIERRRQRNRTN